MLGWDGDIYTIMGLSVALAAAVVLLPLLASILPGGFKDMVSLVRIMRQHETRVSPVHLMNNY